MKINYLLFTAFFIFSGTVQSNPALIIHRGNGAEPDSLDIHQAQGINSQNILMDMYEGLMTFDVNGKVTPGVTVAYKQSNDGLQWTFDLNPLAKWSDGKPLVAEDFLTAWKLAIKPSTAAPYRHLFNNLMTNDQLNVMAASAHQLVIKLNQPDSSLLNKLVLPIFYPLPRNSADIKVSNGAFKLTQWRIHEFIVLEKNEHYYAAEEVEPQQIHYWVSENQNSELLRFRAGELDITETIPDHQIDWLKIHHPNELRISPYYGTFFLGLNLKDKHLSNQKLRKALDAAIDRDILVNKVLKSGQLPAHQIIPTDTPSAQTRFDPIQAKHDLKASGFNTTTEHLEILYNNSNNQKKVALAVAAMWRQNLGIKTKLRNQEWKVFVNTRKGQQKQIFRSGWIADYYNPLDFLNLFQTQSHFNFYGFSDMLYDQTLYELKQQNKDEQAALIIKAESILANKLPVIPLYHYVSRHMVNIQISGFNDNLMDRHLSRYLSKRNGH